MINIMDYEEDGTRGIKQDFVDFSMQDPKLIPEDRTLNFSTSMSEEYDMTYAKKPKTIRDPMSHRIIEKRRRDRMNNCLADLSRLIPTDYLKQGQGRIEKTEIIEMAIKHIKNLTNLVNKQGALKSNLPDRYLGFKECQDEMMRFLVEVEGWDAADRLCIMLMGHLEQAGEKFRIMNDQSLSQVAKEEQYRHADEEMNQQPHSVEPVVPQVEFTNKEGFQNMVPFQTEPYQQDGEIPTQQNDLENNNNTIPSTYPGYEQLLTAQQITQEHLKRDKHLWTLLTSKYSSQVEDSGISIESGMSTSNSKESNRKVNNNFNNENGDSYRGQSSSALNSSPQESCSEKLDSSVYKFKHNITKRFSQEEKKINKSDTSSVGYREEKRTEKLKRKVRHVRSRSPSSSGSSNYPNSNSSNNNSSSGGNEKMHKGAKSQDILPGFILHPDGTHYVPLSIHPSSIGTNIFNKSRSHIYHPISIPVNFGGPVLFLKKVSVQEEKSEATTQSSESMDSPSGCGSIGNSVGDLSDSSPAPEQEVKSGAC